MIAEQTVEEGLANPLRSFTSLLIETLRFMRRTNGINLIPDRRICKQTF